MMTVPILIFFGRWGGFFGCGFNKTLFCLIFLVHFFQVDWLWPSEYGLCWKLSHGGKGQQCESTNISTTFFVFIVIVLSMTQQCVLVIFTMEQWKIDLRKNGSGCGLADSLPHAIQRREARHGERVLRWQNDSILYLIHLLKVIFLGRTYLMAVMLLFAEHFERPQSRS